MRSILKVFFLSLTVFLLCCLSLLAGKEPSEFDRKGSRETDKDLSRPFDPTFRGTQRFERRGDLDLSPWDKHLFYKPGGAPLPPKKGFSMNLAELSSMGAIINDFLVNDDTTGGCAQYEPAIAQDLSGNFVITWSDARNGNYDIYPHYDIYAQRYDSSGTPLGANFKVNDDTGTADQGNPAIAMDESGNFVITWYDERNGNSYAYFDRESYIYAQIYNASAAPLGANFRVNDDTGAGWHDHYQPSIAIDGFGNFIIAWHYLSYYDLGIYAQRYNCSGIPMGANFKVNDAGVNVSSPAVEADARGSFVITWEDDRNLFSDIYAQRCDSSGNLVGANFEVNDDVGVSYHWSPDIARDSSGDFVITWMDYGGYDICFQRYDSSGNPIDTN